MRRAATRDDVLAAVTSDRLRVAGGVVHTRGPHPKSRWRAATREEVHAPHSASPYIRVSFCGLRCLEHRLVWWAAGKDIPPGFELNHRDGNKRNNTVENLETVSPSDNLRHAFAIGLQVARQGGAAAGRRKLTDDQVRAIRSSNATQDALAVEFGVHQSQISKVRTRKTYWWVAA